MLLEITRVEFNSLHDTKLIWRCLEQIIIKIQGKESTYKKEIYAFLTEGQQALLMFQILFGHTRQGIKNFMLYQGCMLGENDNYQQLIFAMKYFKLDEMVDFLSDLRCVYQSEVWDDLTLEKLDEQLDKIIFKSTEIIASNIKNNPYEFVVFKD